jgi:hypothetical protein
MGESPLLVELAMLAPLAVDAVSVALELLVTVAVEPAGLVADEPAVALAPGKFNVDNEMPTYEKSVPDIFEVCTPV